MRYAAYVINAQYQVVWSTIEAWSIFIMVCTRYSNVTSTIRQLVIRQFYSQAAVQPLEKLLLFGNRYTDITRASVETLTTTHNIYVASDY